MSEGLLLSADALLTSMSGFEPRLYDAETCTRIVELLARVVNVCEVTIVAAGARAIECGAHRQDGHNRGADWLAQKTGTSPAEAQRNLDTNQRFDDHPETAEAAKSGDISMHQADEVSKTAAQCPESETEMLKAAKEVPLPLLKEKGRKKRLEAIAPDDLYKQQRAARSFRHWRDESGMVCGSFRLTPEVGVPFVNRVDVETGRQWRNGYKVARPESREQHAADAFAEVVRGAGKPHSHRADVVFVCDVNSGESHIVGGGPVPASVVRDATKQAFVSAVLHDGVKVDTIVRYGRVKIPAMLQLLLELGDPPSFDGMKCTDCGATLGLEADHEDPVANGGATSLSNLGWKCWICHPEKTKRDWACGLLGNARGQPP